jgi:hypothetical protein
MSPITQLQVVGGAKEATFGLWVPATDFFPFTTCTVDSNKKVQRPVRMDGQRGYRRDQYVGLETGITFSSDLYPAGMTKLIGAAFGVGCDTVTGAGAAKTHTLVPMGTLPSWSMEVANDYVTQLLSRQVPGCVMDSITLKATAQSLITLDGAMIGQTELSPATPGVPSFGSPTYPDVNPMDFSMVSSTYNSVASSTVTDITIGLKNSVQRVFTGNASYYAHRLPPTMRDVTFAANFDFVDLTQWTDWNGQSASANLHPISVTFTTNDFVTGTTPYSMVLNYPRMRIQDQFNLASKAEVLEANLAFSVTLGNNANEFNAVIVNAETTAFA